MPTSCELISICIFTWGFTSINTEGATTAMLWIDFNLYFYVRIHKPMDQYTLWLFVVNWFQFVFLREDSQALSIIYRENTGCELISICIFTWGFTRNLWVKYSPFSLWIDFNLYFYVRIHKQFWCACTLNFVVNWFQFVFLREDSQVFRDTPIIYPSCELISICIFTWGFTRYALSTGFPQSLWIDFNLYFYVRIHKKAHPIR